MCCNPLLVKLPKILLSNCKFPRNFSSCVLKENLPYKKFLKNCDDSSSLLVVQSRFKSMKSKLDYSKVPQLDENDLTEQFVRGHGPGGQAVARTNNAVVLKHKPTGIVVKCHETRSLWENKKRAREILITKLDNMMNGPDSIENQKHKLLAKKSASMSRKKEKMAALKEAFKEREGID